MVSHGHDAWHAFFTLFVAISGSLKQNNNTALKLVFCCILAWMSVRFLLPEYMYPHAFYVIKIMKKEILHVLQAPKKLKFMAFF